MLATCLTVLPCWAQMMELVELTPLRALLVGTPGGAGLSVEQRRRLSIAVELVANPSLVLMDEPTTGACASRLQHWCLLQTPAWMQAPMRHVVCLPVAWSSDQHTTEVGLPETW